MPRYQILTTGMKTSKSPNPVRSNKFERNPMPISTTDVEGSDSAVEQPTPWNEDRVSKRKSRLNTTLHLAPKLEISPSDRLTIFREGYLRPVSKHEKEKASLRFYIAKNGMLHEYLNEKEVSIFLT
jgi:hypothetical protein